jgi:hypothetical protein
VGEIGVMPLFVAITPGMRVDFEDEKGGSAGGGGPKREFRANKEMTQPAYRPS